MDSIPAKRPSLFGSILPTSPLGKTDSDADSATPGRKQSCDRETHLEPRSRAKCFARRGGFPRCHVVDGQT